MTRNVACSKLCSEHCLSFLFVQITLFSWMKVMTRSNILKKKFDVDVLTCNHVSVVLRGSLRDSRLYGWVVFVSFASLYHLSTPPLSVSFYLLHVMFSKKSLLSCPSSTGSFIRSWPLKWFHWIKCFVSNYSGRIFS